MLEGDNKIDLYTCTDELLRDVIAQMEKDISLSGDSYSFISTTARDLIREMEAFIGTTKRLSNLMYSADITFTQPPEHQDLNHHISVQIWNRILQKVLIRNTIKTGSK